MKPFYAYIALLLLIVGFSIFMPAPSIDSARSISEIAHQCGSHLSILELPRPIDNIQTQPKTMVVEKDRESVPVNKDHTAISRFLELQNKVLPTEKEKEELERIMSDPKVLHWMERTLLSVTPVDFGKEGQARRFEALHYVEKALSWKENPLRSEILDAAQRIIEENNLKPNQGRAIRRSIIGDKMELFAMLMATEPKRAEEIEGRFKGTPFEKILKYASKRFVF